MGDLAPKEDEIDLRGIDTGVLQAEALQIGYKQGRNEHVSVARDLNLQLKKGELACLVGPNGVGKSTLLRTLAGLQPMLSGKVTLLDKPLGKYHPRELAKTISVVLTEQVNVGAMRAFDVAALGRHPYTNWLGGMARQDEQAVREALAAVGAAPLSERFFNELSDGERQKVMIARALAQEPLILLLDEPTAFLDLPRRVVLMQMLHRLAHQLGKAILVSTHDLDLALHSADMVWLMDMSGNMKVGAPEDLVLGGEFAHAFTQQGVRFDNKTGNFSFSSKTERRIALSANGLARLWTTRALQRAGFEVVPIQMIQDEFVEVAEIDGELVWRLHRAGRAVDHSSIYALLLSLNE